MDLSEILSNLENMAKSDGNVTADEEVFLARLRSNIQDFQLAASQASQDEVISDDEFHDLIVLRDKILGDAVSFQTASEDVKALVNELYNEINDFQIPGMIDEEVIDEDN